MEKNTTLVFPAPMMSGIGELTGFLNRERTAAISSQPDGLSDELLTHAAKLR